MWLPGTFPEKPQVHQWGATDARVTIPNSDSDYQVVHMVEMAYQVPPVYHQYTVRFVLARLGCARRPHA
jgi:hypothetical protein